MHIYLSISRDKVMSRKIGFSHIIRKHFRTLKDQRTGKISVGDLLVFFGLPAVIACLSSFYMPSIKSDILSLSVTFGAITTALLMSVLVLVYDQEAKLGAIESNDKTLLASIKTKLVVLKELYQNICFTILSSLALVVLSFVHIVAQEIFIVEQNRPIFMVLTFLVVFVFINIVLTMLMVIKRFHALISS